MSNVRVARAAGSCGRAAAHPGPGTTAAADRLEAERAVGRRPCGTVDVSPDLRLIGDMADRSRTWLSTEEAGNTVGMTSEWVREQIEAKRLPAFVFETGRRRTYRIRLDHWQRFLSRYRHRTDDPDWE